LKEIPVAYDVFISYASKDKTIADAVCARLEAAGIRCWIAPRDIVAGTSYGEAIIEAIRGLKVMVLVFSSNANASGHIPKEVERAVSNGVAIVPFRIEDVAPGKSLDYFIGSVHWLDAMTPPMEKHLDDLAATVQKLLPAKPGEQGVPVAEVSGVWHRPAPSAPSGTATPSAVVRPAPAPERAQPASSKTIWIGVAAVAVIAAIVIGVILMHGGGNSQTGTTQQNTMNSASNVTPPIPAPVVTSGVDPIVGCYQWFNNGAVVIRANGTMQGGPFPGRWKLVNAATRAYTFTWPQAVDTVTISADQKTLSGGNQYGYPASGTRILGGKGLVGIWNWTNGSPVTITDDGKFLTAQFVGTWRTVNAAQRIYALTWPDPVDSVTLSADGTHVSGQNQYGVTISGVKTGACSGN
jgi:hypothetical protein